MTVLATLVLAWAAVHAYTAIYHASLWARQRSPEHGGFAFLSLSVAVFTLGMALAIDAGSGAEAARGMTVAYSGSSLGTGAFAVFVHQLLGRGRAPLARAALGWGVVGLVLALAGLFVDPAHTRVEHHLAYGFAPDLVEVQTTWLAAAYGIGSLLVVALMLLRLGRGARRADDLTLVVWAALPALVAGVHDVTARIAGIGVIYLLEHALPISSLTISYVLTRRFLRARDELGQRTVELTRSHDELSLVQEELVRKEQLAAVGELAAVVAHEVRNPLAILKNAVSSLRREHLPEQDRHTCLAVLDEEVERLNRLVRDLLAYARPVAPQSVPVQLGDVVDKAIEHARRGSRRRDGVTFDVDLSGGPVTVHGDRDLLEQALINIVENAMEAMEEGGVITVRAKETVAAGRDAVAVTFHDTGEGMDTLVRSRARDPFFTTRPYGTGLGLAIVERVARAHGGTVVITSSRDTGTAVTLVLPR